MKLRKIIRPFSLVQGREKVVTTTARGILNNYIYFDYLFKNKYRVFGSENFFEGFEDDAKSCTRNHA